MSWHVEGAVYIVGGGPGLLLSPVEVRATYHMFLQNLGKSCVALLGDDQHCGASRSRLLPLETILFFGLETCLPTACGWLLGTDEDMPLLPHACGRKGRALTDEVSRTYGIHHS
eukprot:jgi/Botrbrau1/3909/Bobra.0183s0130.1